MEIKYQLALYQIDSLRKEGRFIGVDGTIPEGQGIVMAHLNECHELVEMVGAFTTKTLLMYNSYSYRNLSSSRNQ